MNTKKILILRMVLFLIFRRPRRVTLFPSFSDYVLKRHKTILFELKDNMLFQGKKVILQLMGEKENAPDHLHTVNNLFWEARAMTCNSACLEQHPALPLS